MKLIHLLKVFLLPCSSSGYSLYGTTNNPTPTTPPANFRNVSKNLCDVNEMQCEADFQYMNIDADVDEATSVGQTLDYSNNNFGVVQREEGDAALPSFIMNWKEYMINEVMVDPSYKSIRESCVNKHELCSFWSMLGECDKNPAFMKVSCAPACQSCDQLQFNKRCPFDAKKAKNAFEKGDVDRFFERIVSDDEFARYNITVHSRPRQPDNDDDTVKDGPWLITFDDFITPDEANRLIELGDQEGYKRSTDVGKLKEDGSYTELVNDSSRTSSNAWCMSTCMADPVAQNVVNRIEQVTKIPQVNSESLQLLRYEKGQYYRTHHDLIEHQTDRPPGVRILTFYIYLNGKEDSGLEGGGTNFPELNITVTPKQGRAALWSSVMNDYPHQKDPRTNHAALPVAEGVKFGANAWLHQRDYMTPNSRGCT